MLKVNGLPGLYIIFEGIGGSGKDSQVELLAERILREMPGTKLTVTREPGSTEEGKIIRRRLLNDKTLTGEKEVDLFVQDRILNQEQVVLPALREGGIVVQNRSFISNMAYQGHGKGLGIERVLEVNLAVVSKVPPDVIVFLDVGWEVGKGRFGKTENDKFDQTTAGFWQRVETGYLQSVRRVSEIFPTEILVIEDKNGELDRRDTHSKVWIGLEPNLDLLWRIREGLATHSLTPEGVGRPQKERV